MAYVKKTWVNENVQYPNRYTKSGETASEVTLVRSVGTVVVQDPISASAMNNMENGIFNAHALADTAQLTANISLAPSRIYAYKNLGGSL